MLRESLPTVSFNEGPRRMGPGLRRDDDVHSRSATRPKFCKKPSLPPKHRGRRESRVSDAPAAARVVVVNTRVSHHEFTGNIRLSPRNGFNGLFRALPGDRALLPPSPLRSLLLKNLTPASGCQDHTTSPSARVSFARTLSCTDTVASTASRIQRP